MMHLTSRILAVLLFVACRTTTSSDPTGEPAPGVAASIVHETVIAAGGRVSATVVTFDSLAATFEERHCPIGENVATCPGMQRRTGSLDRVAFAELWRIFASAEFRSLRPFYGFTGGIVPPDANGVTVTVVANGRRWRVSRDARAPSPAILSRIDCRLQVARGMLISCA
jgi:hypothetical protein